MPPLTLLIKPASSLCNLRCEYCFYHDVAENRSIKSYGMMTTQTLETLVRKALSYADLSCTFAFQGGEPTLAGLGFYEKLLKFQKKNNKKNVKIFNMIQTNGYEMEDNFARFLGENHFLVGLSLDGGRKLHDSLRMDAEGKGTFNQVMNTAALFDKYKVEYNILCVVNNFVARHPEQVYQFFKKKGFRFLQFIECLDGFDGKKQNFSLSPARFTVFLKGIFDEYYKDFIKGEYTSVRMFDNFIGILAGNRPECCGMRGFCSCNFVIEGDGSVFPCDFYVLDKYYLGNIKESHFAELENAETAKRFVEESKYVDSKCQKCKWYFLCRSGCRRYKEPFTDGLPSLNKYCESYEAFFEYAFNRLREITASVTGKFS